MGTGGILRVPVGVISKTRDNQLDLANKLANSYLPSHSIFNVEAVNTSKAGRDRVLKSWSNTAFVMAATGGQLKAFLDCMAYLQAREMINGWILVLDESDALRT